MSAASGTWRRNGASRIYVFPEHEWLTERFHGFLAVRADRSED